MIAECERGLAEPAWSGSVRNRESQIRRRVSRNRTMLELLNLLRLASAFDARKAESLIRKDSAVVRSLLADDGSDCRG